MDIQAFFREYGRLLVLLAVAIGMGLQLFWTSKTWGRPREDQPEEEQEIEKRGNWVLIFLGPLFLLILLGGDYFL